MPYAHTIGARAYRFVDLKTLLAKATPLRSGDALAGLAAALAEERVAARFALADLPLRTFLAVAVIPYETDEVTRLIVDTHDAAAFAPVAHLTVGGFRDWLLSDVATPAALAALAPGITPEMAAAVSKLMRNQDLIVAARKCRVVTKFRNTLGLPGRLAVRLQPNHPTDDLRGIAASMLDGLLYGSGDAVIGINPASDDVAALGRLVRVLDDVISRHAIPTQSCVLTHVTNTLRMIDAGVPVDLVFQSVAGTQQANASFGVDLGLLREAHAAARSLARGTVGQNAMYFETGQGSALSAGAHHGVDQQTCEARAYAVARAFEPLLVNSVVGFIGPEYLYDGKQIVRAGLEDHFCGKLLGLPMGCDVCYTNHAEADSDDMDALLTLLGAAGINFVMGVPGADDIMLNYQSTSFHDALYLREVLGLKRAPEFEAWLERVGVADAAGRLLPANPQHPLLLAGLGVATSNDADALPAAPAAAAPAPTAPDPWTALRTHTAARIALGRSGVSLPTGAVLAFGLAHAQARDAVHLPFDAPALAAQLAPHGFRTLEVESAAGDRATYLHRPDLGRRLSPRSAALLGEAADDTTGCDVSCDVLCVVADGLSAAAVHAHAAALLLELRPRLEASGLRIGPVVLAHQARVALGDEIGAALRARLVVVLIGERPGLSSPDSLGAYLTWAPRVGRSDAERNCVSNIRPQGLPVDAAAAKIAWLIGAAGRLGATGVRLKDESATALLPHAEPPLLAGR